MLFLTPVLSVVWVSLVLTFAARKEEHEVGEAWGKRSLKTYIYIIISFFLLSVFIHLSLLKSVQVYELLKGTLKCKYIVTQL